MNRALLDQLQQMRSYPSITVLFNTQPRSTFGTDETARAQHLAATARDRLEKLLTDDPAPLVHMINTLVQEYVVSDATVRSFAGNRQRLAEERSDEWPLRRGQDISDTIWSQTVTIAATRLRQDHAVPTEELEHARSAKRYAAGVDELWSLAEDGRVKHLVVESDFGLAA